MMINASDNRYHASVHTNVVEILSQKDPPGPSAGQSIEFLSHDKVKGVMFPCSCSAKKNYVRIPTDSGAALSC